MGDTTAIAWTDHTLNPWMGCQKISQGCKNCYAETLVKDRMNLDVWGPGKPRKRTSPGLWKNPLVWDRLAYKEGRPHRVFSGSLCDVFEDHPDANKYRPELFDLIRKTPNLQWQILTKRPNNFPRFLPMDWEQGYPNVWLGTSVENIEVARRVDALRSVPASVRFISYEPALGPLDDLDITGIDWIIYGGESGQGYRPHNLAWPRAMKKKCEAAGVAFFYKQSSAPRTEMGIELDGEIVRNYPTPRHTAPTTKNVPLEFSF